MAHPYHHALSSVKKWGGTVDDFMAVHSWFDASKMLHADFRHRALRHHAESPRDFIKAAAKALHPWIRRQPGLRLSRRRFYRDMLNAHEAAQDRARSASS